jgi:hypothetical protein
MSDINTLYHNDFGISFVWKTRTIRNKGIVEIVFRDTGLSLSYNDIETMYAKVKSEIITTSLCKDCINNKKCKLLLLELPSSSVSFAMSYFEMTQMLDLLKGTLFQLDLNELIDL